MIVNIGMRRRTSPKGTIFTDADWVYAGGATVASPATAYSNVNGANSVTIKYNGVVAYLTKTVSGAVTYATVPVVLAAGTYRVKGVVNADNSMTLYVNGTASQNGYSNEMITAQADREFSSDTGWWTKSGTSSIGGGVGNVAGTSTQGLRKTGFTTSGKIYKFSVDLVTVTTGGIRFFLTNTAFGATSTPGTQTYTRIADGASWSIYGSTGTDNCAIDNATFKEVYNNTDTQKYTFA